MVQEPAAASDQPLPPTGTPDAPPPQYSRVDDKPEAPPPAEIQTDGNAWSTDLCDCFDDIPSCCLTFWCPCITFGQISEIIDKGSSSCVLNGLVYLLISYVLGCPCFYSCCYRSKLRKQYQLAENPCGDCLVHCCCEPCALCQEYRELKHRGFDMCIGWEGNVEKQNCGITMAPIVQGKMSR